MGFSFDIFLPDVFEASISSILQRKGRGKAIVVRLIGDELTRSVEVYW